MTAAAQTSTDKNINAEDLLSDRLQQYDNATISTSIDRIGASLAYLAQCDYAFGNSNSDLNDNGCFGRGDLLDMLSSGISSFATNFERTENLYRQQIQQQQNTQDENANLKTQNAKLTLLTEKYQQLLALDDKDSQQAKKLQQQINDLESK